MSVFLLGHDVKYTYEDINQKILKAMLEWKLLCSLGQMGLGLNSDATMRYLSMLLKSLSSSNMYLKSTVYYALCSAWRRWW